MSAGSAWRKTSSKPQACSPSRECRPAHPSVRTEAPAVEAARRAIAAAATHGCAGKAGPPRQSRPQAGRPPMPSGTATSTGHRSRRLGPWSAGPATPLAKSKCATSRCLHCDDSGLGFRPRSSPSHRSHPPLDSDREPARPVSARSLCWHFSLDTRAYFRTLNGPALV